MLTHIDSNDNELIGDGLLNRIAEVDSHQNSSFALPPNDVKQTMFETTEDKYKKNRNDQTL